MHLSADTIRLGAKPTNKREAIELAGLVLAQSGHIERDYIRSMMEREKQANTFLGRGIAIPHGMAPDRHLIKETGVAVVQVPEGVEWNENERVDLVVAIAAKSDEHLSILASLMDVLDNEALIERLTHTTNVEEIAAALNGSPSPSPTASTGIEGESIVATIASPQGLHARPAARLAELAAQFSSNIFVEFKGQRVSAKATVSLLKLGVGHRDTVRLIATGLDAAQSLVVLKEAIESGLGDPLEVSSTPKASQLPHFTPVTSLTTVHGIGAAPGLAVAPLHFWHEQSLHIEDKSEGSIEEKRKLALAREAASGELEKLSRQVEIQGNKDEAAIFRSHTMLLQDAELLAATDALIEEGHGAAWAWYSAIQTSSLELSANANSVVAGRSSDLQDIGTRVLHFLGYGFHHAHELPEHPVILVAHDLLPSQTIALDRQRVVGLCTAVGGPTSHTAILARALGIPAVVGAGTQVMSLRNGQAILDGAAGKLFLQPTAADLNAAADCMATLRGVEEAEHTDRFRPALTRDGHRIEVVANVGNAADTQKALENGAEGVGLLRTELLFLGRDSAPSEEEQFEALTDVTSTLNGLPLIVRTLDIGGDKGVGYLDLPHEDNPFLGVRGARLTLRHPDLFKTQLRAIFRASETGLLRLLFPMIGTIEEWRQAREMAESVRNEVGALAVDYGVMIEVPSAALLAREFAQEVDFFSIGTNDLTQYTLAVDRLHPTLSQGADALHPAVLRLIDMTVEAAREAEKWVGVCGGAADETLGALILAGLGVSELSVSGPSVPRIKAALRASDHTNLRSLAKEALRCGSAAEVRRLGGLS